MADVGTLELTELGCASDEAPVGDAGQDLQYMLTKEREKEPTNSRNQVKEISAFKLGTMGATDAAATEQKEEDTLRQARPMKEQEAKTVASRVEKPRTDMPWMQKVRRTTAAQMEVNAAAREQLKAGQPTSLRATRRAVRKAGDNKEDQMLEAAIRRAEEERAAATDGAQSPCILPPMCRP